MKNRRSSRHANYLILQRFCQVKRTENRHLNKFRRRQLDRLLSYLNHKTNKKSNWIERVLEFSKIFSSIRT